VLTVLTLQGVNRMLTVLKVQVSIVS